METVLILTVVGLLIGFVVSAARHKKPKPTDTHGTSGLATNAMLKAAGLIGAASGKGIRLGMSRIAAGGLSEQIIRYTGENSVTIIGPPGTGKMVSLAAAMTVEYGGSMVILDPKGELLAITQRAREDLGRVIVLCPFKEGLPVELAHYADETDSYNPLDLLDPKSESFEMNCDTLAETLIAPDGSGESKESGFFTGNAQALVSGVIMQLALNFPARANLTEVASIVCSDLIFAFAAEAMETGNRYVMDRLSNFASPDAHLLNGGMGDILRTAREQLKWISNAAIARVLQSPKELWRFEDLKESRTTVFVVLPAKYLASTRRFFRLLLGSAVGELQSSPKGMYPVLCLADEFALLGRVPIFETVFAEGRGHGFKVVPLIQNIGQLKSLYGRESYRTFLSGSEIQIFLPPRDLETAQEISDLMGAKTVVVENKSYSTSTPGSIGQIFSSNGENTGYGETGRPVLFPQEIMALSPEEFIMFAPGLMKDVYIGWRQPYWETDIAPLCDRNPYNPKTPTGHMVVACPWCGEYALRGAPSMFTLLARNGGYVAGNDNDGWGLPCHKCKKYFTIPPFKLGENRTAFDADVDDFYEIITGMKATKQWKRH